MQDEVSALFEEILNKLLKQKKTREIALAITKVQAAFFWWQDHLDKEGTK